MEELKPTSDLLVGLQTRRGWGPVHFAEAAQKWMHTFAKTGRDKELRELEDFVRRALYHEEWQSLGTHLFEIFQHYRGTELYNRTYYNAKID